MCLIISKQVRLLTFENVNFGDSGMNNNAIAQTKLGSPQRNK